jgi:uncharacterized membrane protein
VENGKYDFQIITFQDLKNAAVIAGIATIGPSFYQVQMPLNHPERGSV